MRLILVWLLNALALLAVAHFLPGVHVASFGAAMIAAAVIGLINMLLRPILVILTLPVTLLTLGLFILIINGLLFYLAGSILQGFQVDTFGTAVIGAILYSIVSWVLSLLIPRAE
ncbi:phage holin family protein [Ampullimonas aquatilis]|uniref:phage holin family protein n=1 Tax=Ampullimonas aquatilis TaxID=1341549 RepID=UPI003C7429B9